MHKHLKISIFGKVSRSGFRFSAILLAEELGLTGFIRKQNSGFYLEVEGEVENLKKFLKWCHQGPEGAQVEKVEYSSSENLQNFKGFQGWEKEEE